MKRSILLLLLPVLCAQEAVAPPSPAFHRDRRERLLEALRTELGPGEDAVVLLRGEPDTPDMAAFYQGHEFAYLTGVREPNCALLMFVRSGEQVLLVPPMSRFTATWEGTRLAPGEEAARATGFATVENVRSLRERLDQALQPREGGTRPKLYTLLRPAPTRAGTDYKAAAYEQAMRRDFLDGRPTSTEALEQRLTERYPGVVIEDLAPHLNLLRMVKQPEEIAQIKAATEAAAHGIAEAMKSCEPGVYEFQLAAAARFVFNRLSGSDDAYAAIVGSGPNGCVLHYSASSKRCEAGELVVMDYAPAVNGYCADVTRTFPVDGRFTPEQRKLVQDVHDVQQALIAQIKPGVSLGELSQQCSRMLMQRGYRVDHGPCHHVGLAVHDANTGDDRLEPGMVITVEPGAYLRDKGMGCRIEDMVLVTEDGAIVLSAGVPSTPDEIEKLMAQPGILQQPYGIPAK